MANTEKTAAQVGDQASAANWLSDMALSGSRQRGVLEVEVAIMRLSGHPELLHRFLALDSAHRTPSAGSLIGIAPLFQSVSGGSETRSASQAQAYLASSPGMERADSLQPHVFFPTFEDAQRAIPASSDSPVCHDARPGTDRLGTESRLMLALVAGAAVLVGLWFLA